MSLEIDSLARQLGELAEAPAPPLAVDIARAREQGRRRLRRRTAMVGTAAGLALAIGVAAGTLPTPARRAPAPAAPVAGHDPLVVPAAFGWLPESVTSVGYQAGGLGGTLVEARGNGSLGPDLQLRLYPAGAPPALGSFATGTPQYALPAAPINGSKAFWITGDTKDPTNAGEPFLRWQVADGRWAEITGSYLGSSVKPLEDLPHMAATAVIRDHSVPLPVRITGLPAGFTIQNIDLYRPSPAPGSGPWAVEMMFTFAGGHSAVTLGVRPAGYPGVGTACTTAKGLTGCLKLSGAEPAALRAIGGLPGLSSRITLLGTDETAWTTAVLVR